MQILKDVKLNGRTNQVSQVSVFLRKNSKIFFSRGKVFEKLKKCQESAEFIPVLVLNNWECYKVMTFFAMYPAIILLRTSIFQYLSVRVISVFLVFGVVSLYLFLFTSAAYDMKVVHLTNIPTMFSATREKIRVLISFNFGTFFSLRYDRAFARLPSSARRNRPADISAGNLSLSKDFHG